MMIEDEDSECKEDLIEALNNLESDKDNLAVGIEFLNEEIYSLNCVEKRLIKLHDDLTTWSDSIQDSLDKLEEAISKFKKKKVLKNLEEKND